MTTPLDQDALKTWDRPDHDDDDPYGGLVAAGFNPAQGRDEHGRWADVGASGAASDLRDPDSGFTMSASKKPVPIGEGFAVALRGSDRLFLAADAFDAHGRPKRAMVTAVRERITAAMKTKPPDGTKMAVGAWHNPDDGKIEVNVTVVFPRNQEARATAFAQEHDQISILNLHDFVFITTGGTGGDRTVEDDDV